MYGQTQKRINSDSTDCNETKEQNLSTNSADSMNLEMTPNDNDHCEFWENSKPIISFKIEGIVSQSTDDSQFAKPELSKTVKSKILKIANLKAIVGNFESKILFQRRHNSSNQMIVENEQLKSKDFCKSFSDLLQRTVEFRKLNLSKNDKLETKRHQKIQEARNLEIKLAEIDKNLLNISISFSNRKIQFEKKSRPGIFQKLFG